MVHEKYIDRFIGDFLGKFPQEKPHSKLSAGFECLNAGSMALSQSQGPGNQERKCYNSHSRLKAWGPVGTLVAS